MSRKLVRRAARAPEIRLGEPFEPLVQPWLGARFPLPGAKEADLLSGAPRAGAPRRRQDMPR